MRCRWGLLALLLAQPVLADAARFVQAFGVPGSSATVTVAEGEGEPRSLGSYSIRLYGGANPAFPQDDFIAGLVRSRDGTVGAVRFADLDGGAGYPEVVVILRAAGSGGYQSVDVFRISRDALVWQQHLRGLPADADPLAVLQALPASGSGGAGPLQLPHRGQRTQP